MLLPIDDYKINEISHNFVYTINDKKTQSESANGLYDERERETCV